EAAGGVCEGDARCVFDCEAEGACAEAIQCPAGYACEVSCGDSACGDLVTCPATDHDCDVSCAGQDSCAGGVRCEGGACDVGCTGGGSCAGDGVFIREGEGFQAESTVSCSGPGSGTCEGDGPCDAVFCGSVDCKVTCIGPGSCVCSGDG